MSHFHKDKDKDTHTFDEGVQAPFLRLTPIPSLLIDDTNISFQMEVMNTDATKTTVNTEASMNAGSDFNAFCFSQEPVEVNSKVSSSRESTRNTNPTAKYNVNITARRQPPTEGLNKLMDIPASCTAPLTISDSGGDNKNDGGDSGK